MKLCALSICTLGIFLFTGCTGSESVSTVPAGGTVTLDGQPLADADVTFHPVGEGEGRRSASGKTDAQGKFKVGTYVDAGKLQDGAVPGEYAVTVNKVAGSTASMGPEAMMKAMSNKTGAPKKSEDSELTPDSAIPEKYTSPKSSGLKAVVKEGDANDFPLEVKGS
jgi:hypothetical protein